MNEILKILITFALTTVVGGVLGYIFQTRSWRHQNNAKQLESERATATKIFEEVSRLMDKRLYRMRQLYWRLKDSLSEDDILEKHMSAYREVLYEWNDNLNRNLALSLAYFGKDIRSFLEITIYEEFSKIGSLIENYYKERKRAGKITSPVLSGTGTELTKLGFHIYTFNVRVISLIQNGTVGIFNPDTKQSHNNKARTEKNGQE
jgi:hypothetical protein